MCPNVRQTHIRISEHPVATSHESGMSVIRKTAAGPSHPSRRSRGDPAFGGTHRNPRSGRCPKFMKIPRKTGNESNQHTKKPFSRLVDAWRYSDWIGWYPNICPKSVWLSLSFVFMNLSVGYGSSDWRAQNSMVWLVAFYHHIHGRRPFRAWAWARPTSAHRFPRCSACFEYIWRN